MVIKQLVVGPFESNCYIVGSDVNREGMIIDPGDEAQKILKTVNDLKLDIKYIVLTHGHIDHIGALAEVKEATRGELTLHEDEASTLPQSQHSSFLFGLSYPPPPPADRLLKGGDNLTIGDLQFLVLHTPGHSPGCICILGHRVMFTGDTLFNLGIGRYDLPGGNYSQLMNSIHTKLMVLPDDTIIYPGHGPQSTIGDERKWNPFLRNDQPAF